MLQLKQFQQTAVDKLLICARKLFPRMESSVCVLKAPTGSGKTIIMADFLKQLSEEDLGNENGYVFIWIAPRQLHGQSKDKLDRYLGNSVYSLMKIEEMAAAPLAANTILFVNWEKLTDTYKQNTENGNIGDWSNVYVRDREDGRSIKDVLAKTRNEGRQIVLIVDEAHLNVGKEQNNAWQFIKEVICPHVTFEVSATPQTVPSHEDLNDGKAGLVIVRFDDVVAEGLIKRETMINGGVENYTEFAGSADEVVLTAALAKRNDISRIYELGEIAVKPLVLIQLPNKNKSMNDLDLQMKAEVEKFLAEKNITYENGKLAVWLSEEKSESLQGIERNNSPVEVLIFKTAIATGWDCPRAQILVMLRPIGSVTFEIQTVGRILRMPEARHYDAPDLNRAFIYTNIPTLAIKEENESLEFFKVKTTRLKKEIQNVTLPSVFLHRVDYGDLTQKFENILVEELDRRFGITEQDWWLSDALEKFRRKKLLELEVEKLKMPILSNVVVQNIDKMEEEMRNAFVNKVNLTVSTRNIQRQFDYLANIWSLPYAPSRSFVKIKQAIYRWFEHLGYDHRRYRDVQRIITCSEKNQAFFTECINAAKETYEVLRQERIREKRRQMDFVFSLPSSDDFGDHYESFQAKKYVYGKCYLRKDRSGPEKEFEKKIDASDNVEWWYKNGEKKQQYFAIAYETTMPETGFVVLRAFYPDYIIRWQDGRIGIYDTKSGFTAAEAGPKSNVLQKYIKEQGTTYPLTGGILHHRSGGWYLFDADEYSIDLTHWKPFEF